MEGRGEVRWEREREEEKEKEGEIAEREGGKVEIGNVEGGPPLLFLSHFSRLLSHSLSLSPSPSLSFLSSDGIL